MSDREQRLREQAEAKGWALLPYDVILPDTRGVTGFRLIAQDGYVVIGRGIRVLDPPAHLCLDLEGVEDALKYLECAVLRCGAEVADLIGIPDSSRRIELRVCSDHKRRYEAGEPWSYDASQDQLLMGQDVPE